MEKQQIRDLIRDYTHGKGCVLNKSTGVIEEQGISQDTILDLYETDLKYGVKDATRSMAMNGLNKLFSPENDNEEVKFELNFFEKCIIFTSAAMTYYEWPSILVTVFLIAYKILWCVFEKNTKMAKQQAVKTEYIAMREGKKVKIDESDIVVGDILYLKAGIKVPVDGLFMVGNCLVIDESEVSGESQKWIKKPLGRWENDSSSPLVISYTNVINGWGWMVVVSVGEKSTGYARQAVFAHQNFGESEFENISRTKIEFLHHGYNKVLRNVWVIVPLTMIYLIGVYFFYFKNTEYIVFQIVRYLMQGAIIIYFSQQFLVEKFYDRFFKTSCYELSKSGVHINKHECFENVAKTQTLVFNRSGILTTNEYILQKLWLGNEIAEFEQNFENLEITKPLQADEATVEILTQALLGNIDEVMPNSIDRAFIRFLISIVGITEQELPDQIATNYDPSNFRIFANSNNKRMMTLIDRVSGDKKLLVKGSLDELYRQCTYYVDDEGSLQRIDDETRQRIKSELDEAITDYTIPLWIWSKDISKDDLKPHSQNHDSGGGPSDEDFEEFLNDQADLTLIAVALFKNPVNIWVPSCISKLHKTGLKTFLVSSSNSGPHYAKECGITNEGSRNEEIDAKEFYEKAPNNRLWLEHNIHQLKVMSKANSLHKYFLTDCLVNMYSETMLITNKHDDSGALNRAQIGVSVSKLDNSSLIEASAIVLSKRGFLELPNLFKYANYIEICIKEWYVFWISSMLSVTILSLIFALFKANALFDPTHLLILLVLELAIGKFLFKTIKDNEDFSFEKTDSEETGYSLDEKSRKIMIYHIWYSIFVPSIIFVFDMIPSENGYSLQSEDIKNRIANGLPRIHTFIFIFLIISRVCSALNFRCKTLPAWLKVIKEIDFWILVASVLTIMFFSHIAYEPLTFAQQFIWVLLGMGTLLIQIFTSSLKAIQNSQGFKDPKHQSMREMQRLDFTSDFD